MGSEFNRATILNMTEHSQRIEMESGMLGRVIRQNSWNKGTQEKKIKKNKCRSLEKKRHGLHGISV